MVHHSRYHLSPTGRDLLVVDDSGSHMTPFNGLPMAMVEANGLESRGDHVGGTERHAYCHHVRECLGSGCCPLTAPDATFSTGAEGVRQSQSDWTVWRWQVQLDGPGR